MKTHPDREEDQFTPQEERALMYVTIIVMLAAMASIAAITYIVYRLAVGNAGAAL